MSTTSRIHRWNRNRDFGNAPEASEPRGSHASGSLEQQEGTPVRAREGQRQEARRVDEARQGDRREDRQQGARQKRRGETLVPLFADGHLVRPPRRPPVPQRAERSDEGAALQPDEAPEHQGPLVDEQAAAPGGGQPQEVVDPAPGLTSTDRLNEVRPKTLDHVALWVADRDRIADFLTERLSMHVIEQTDKFTLVGTDARRGKLTLFVAEGPRERGALKHVGLGVSDLEG